MDPAAVKRSLLDSITRSMFGEEGRDVRPAEPADFPLPTAAAVALRLSGARGSQSLSCLIIEGDIWAEQILCREADVGTAVFIWNRKTTRVHLRPATAFEADRFGDDGSVVLYVEPGQMIALVCLEPNVWSVFPYEPR